MIRSLHCACSKVVSQGDGIKDNKADITEEMTKVRAKEEWDGNIQIKGGRKNLAF